MVRNRRQTLRVGAIVVAATLAGGCTGAGGSAPPTAPIAAGSPSGATSVAAKLSEFRIELDGTTAPAGSVTFQITNAGTVEHEFVVVATDLALDKLPVEGGEVDEDSSELSAIDEVEEIAPGGAPALTVTLPAGHYVLFCNIEGHYAGGMRAELTTNG